MQSLYLELYYSHQCYNFLFYMIILICPVYHIRYILKIREKLVLRILVELMWIQHVEVDICVLWESFLFFYIIVLKISKNTNNSLY